MLMKKIPSCFNFGVLIITHHENRLIMRNSIHLFELKRKFPYFSFYTVVHDIRLTLRDQISWTVVYALKIPQDEVMFQN